MTNGQRRRAAKEERRIIRADVLDQAVARIEARGRRPRELRTRERTGAQKRRGRVGLPATP